MLRAFRERAVVLCLLIVLGGILGALVGALSPESYRSTAYLLVVPEERSAAGASELEAASASDYARAYTGPASDPVSGREIFSGVVEDVGVGRLLESTTLGAVSDAPLITASVEWRDPNVAVTLNDRVGESMVEYARSLAASTGYAAEAAPSAAPRVELVEPNWRRNVALGSSLALGAGLAGILLAPTFERYRPRLEIRWE